MLGKKFKKRISWRMFPQLVPCFRKKKYSHKEHKFFETKDKETFIHKAENSPGQCWSKPLLWFWLIWKLSGSKVSAKIDRTSFSMVLTIFTFTLSTIYSFTEVYFTSITARDGVKILEPNRRRSANFHPSLKRMHCKHHHYFSNLYWELGLS